MELFEGRLLNSKKGVKKSKRLKRLMFKEVGVRLFYWEDEVIRGKIELGRTILSDFRFKEVRGDSEGFIWR